MKRNVLGILVVLFVANSSQAQEPMLQKIPKSNVSPAAMPGYIFDFDQVFKIRVGPLKGKTIFFAKKDPEQSSGEPTKPRFVVAEDKLIIDQMDLPTIEDVWNLTTVDAISAIPTKKGGKVLRIIAILTMEPGSGRSSDYWAQPFVFDISDNGKIDSNLALNTNLSTAKPSIKTIKALKKYLDQTAAR